MGGDEYNQRAEANEWPEDLFKQQSDANELPEDEYKHQAETNEWHEDLFKHRDSADEKTEEKQQHHAEEKQQHHAEEKQQHHAEEKQKHHAEEKQQHHAEEKQQHHALFKRDLGYDPGFDGEVVKSAQDYSKSERKDKKGAKMNKKPPRTDNVGNFDMMKPSMHTIVACITVMLAVFHIVICLSVWQQCKIHRNPATVQTIAVDQQQIRPPRRPRNGDQSFSALVEEPPLIGQVPMPPEYKEDETSKPPSYHIILNNSSSRGDETTTNGEPI